ncbi:MAG: hypothetical protein AAGN46_14845 [Acidobacteriota bacterium]
MSRTPDAPRSTDLSTLLDLEVDGQATSAERRRLEAHLREDPRLRAERLQLVTLNQALAEDRIDDGGPELRAAVMARIGPARSPTEKTPRAIVALVVGMAGAWMAAAFAVGLGSGGDPMLGLGAALADFGSSTVLAGAGLTAATWTGLGFGLAELFSTSTSTLLAMALSVLCLNLLFWSLLRRRGDRPDFATAEASGPDAG